MTTISLNLHSASLRCKASIPLTEINIFTQNFTNHSAFAIMKTLIGQMAFYYLQIKRCHSSTHGVPFKNLNIIRHLCIASAGICEHSQCVQSQRYSRSWKFLLENPFCAYLGTRSCKVMFNSMICFPLEDNFLS